jgi:hypothetical protein
MKGCLAIKERDVKRCEISRGESQKSEIRECPQGETLFYLGARAPVMKNPEN